MTEPVLILLTINIGHFMYTFYMVHLGTLCVHILDKTVLGTFCVHILQGTTGDNLCTHFTWHNRGHALHENTDSTPS